MALKRLRVLIADRLGIDMRESLSMICLGRVKVNGIIGKPTLLVHHDDTVTVDEQPIPPATEPLYVLFNKPRGIECTMNENIPDNLLTVFKYPKRLFPVGRLDKESEGLLLMVNDGKLYRSIAHADNKQEKEYYVEVHKPITEEFLVAMRSGVKILQTITNPCEVFPVAESEFAFRIILKQGMNRQIRRMSYNLGFSVRKLVRTRIMHLELGELKAGEWRNLTDHEKIPLTTLPDNLK